MRKGLYLNILLTITLCNVEDVDVDYNSDVNYEY